MSHLLVPQSCILCFARAYTARAHGLGDVCGACLRGDVRAPVPPPPSLVPVAFPAAPERAPEAL